MIELKNLSAGYGRERILDSISLTVPKGKLVSIIGANGSGKSTLLKTIVGIISPESGDILIDDKPTTDLSRKDIAKRISYLCQGKSVPDMTVEQMVMHGRFPYLKYPRKYSKIDREIADRAIEEMGISALAERTMSSLSGGMRQKAYIAMALTQDTDYILLDEPTTFLDISGQLELMRILRVLTDNGKGIAAVMHDLPLAFSCSDSIAVLQNGRISACDTPQNICQSGIVKSVFGVELGYCAEGDYYHYNI